MKNAILGEMVADRPQRPDAELVRAASNDDPTAFGDLFERWFDRVYDVARNIVRNDDTAAEVAQDVFLNAWQRLDQLDDAERFGGWLLRSSRNRALNRLEKERRAKPLDGGVVTGLHEGMHGGGGDRDDLVGSNRVLETESISDAHDQQNLVWAAAAALGPRDASLLDLQLRHQLSPAEIAEELDLTANNAHQLLFRLRKKLGDAVANHLLWRGGAPRCEELAALVEGDPFDAAINKLVQRHSSRCDTCGPERERVVDPTKLFASVPIAVAPLLVRARAASALEAAGVPTSTGPMPSPQAPSPQTSGTGLASDGAGIDDTSPQTGGSKALVGAAPAPLPSEQRSFRRLGFLVVVLAIVGGATLVLSRPTGEIDLAIESTTTVSPADTAPEPEPPIAAPTTTEPPPRSTTTVSTTTVSTTTTTTAPDRVTSPPSEPPADPDPPPDPPAAPLPVIVRFVLQDPPGAIFCPDPTDTARTAKWLAEETTEASLTTPNGTTTFTDRSTHTFCAPTGSVITLTATGPGGTVTDTETIS